ncbi:unnamed protein product [Sphagnum jensenii]|uniref:Uncharacterized protein n=1 Tax=Sphagnum jensenii TaxID=128206 RepID=A0ABP1AK34_9BRYO
MGVGLCGLQELRWPHVGECNIVVPSSVQGHRGEGDWKLVWSGANQHLFAGASKMVGTQGLMQQNRSGLSLSMVEIVAAKDLINEVRKQLDVAVRNVEGVLPTQGDNIGVVEEPTLVKVQACVQCLCDAVAPCEDGINAPLFKACPEGIEWLHWVILGCWAPVV